MRDPLDDTEAERYCSALPHPLHTPPKQIEITDDRARVDVSQVLDLYTTKLVRAVLDFLLLTKDKHGRR